MSEKTNPNMPYGNTNPYPPQPTPAYYPVYPMRQFPPQAQFPQAQTQQQAPAANIPGMLPIQQSYIENILRLNRGKLVTAYMTFENTEQTAFTGIIEAAGRDHLILSDPNTGRRYLLLMVYLDYVTFDEEINYEYPFGGSTQQLTTYQPR